MQQILQGIDHLPAVLRRGDSVLLVCDASYPYLCIKENIEQLGAHLVKFDGFTSNPLYEDVCKGVELFNREHCQSILAVGGGSTIDVAKCIKLYAKMPADRVYLEQPYADTGIPLIAIPTTAGTGSESTRYAVIYHEGKKQSVTHESILPNVAILEPRVLRTLPVYQKKCTMLDALCQGIESWWSVNSTDESKQLSRKAVEAIAKWWRAYVLENAEASWSYIMEAANEAGRAINITQTTAPHAFSYKLTSLYGLPHGHAVAVCLPEIWGYMLSHPEKCIDRRGEAYLLQTFTDIAHSLGCSTPMEACAMFRNLLAEMGMEKPQGKEREGALQTLSASVNPVRMKNNPVALGQQAIYGLYNKIVAG